MNLGTEPWLGLPHDPHTKCGCMPPMKGKKMIRHPSPDEKVQAILDARKPLAEYLQQIGKIEVMEHFTKDEICGLIRAAQEGVQTSLRQQMNWDTYDGEIPF